MSTPALEITAYTPLETLLLFYNLSTHGIHPTSFSLISNILVRNPLVKNGDTFDRGRLAPDALKEFYLLQLREAELELGNGADGQPNGDGGRQGSPATSRKKKAKTPPVALLNPDKTGVVKILTSRLYEKYRNTVFQQIRDDERRYAELDREFNDISAGLWDERLLRENAVKARSRSSSTTPKSSKQKRVSSSPGLDRRNATPSVSPIAEARDEPLATSVSVEVSPRALPAARTPTAQHAVPQLATQKSPQLKSSLPLRPNNHSGKTEQQNTPRNVTDRPPRNVPAPTPLSQKSPPPHTRDQVQEGQRESYMPLAQTKRDVMKVVSTPPKSQPTAGWASQTTQTASSSPRQTQAHRALAAPIPSPQVPQKMEAVPPPPPSSTSSPVAPPLSRPGVKIEAPVPPPTRTPFPPITPRPIQGPYPQPQNTLSRPSSVPGSGQSPQGLTGLQQLADVADTRWQQQHTPPYVQHGAPLGQHIVYSSPGQPVSYGPAPISPNIPQGHRTPTPSTPGATTGFAVLFPTALPTTPGPPVQQYPPQFSPQNQARQAGVQTPNFQHYNPHVAAQQQQQSFEQVPPVSSPTVQRIAPRPPPLVPLTPPAATLQQSNPISPSKTRPPPIVTSTGSTDILPFSHSPGHKGEPGSPIPPRPDEISPISTPSRSPPPPPESPKLAVSVEKPRGKKRLFQDDGKSPQDRRKSGGSKENAKQARADRAKEDKPAPKRQKKHEKTPAKSPVTRRGSVVGKEVGIIVAVPENKVKDEEADITEIESDAQVSIVDEEEKPQKPRGRGRPRGKAKPPPPLEEQVEPPVKEKRTKRKRTEVNAPTPQTVDGDEEESEAEAASVSPTPQRRHFPKLENQGSNLINSVPSPSPLTVSIGQQPLVVATKKFLQLSAPLLGDISSHKFANLFSHAVNERMAPGYRNLVFRPQDLKSIKAAVKSGTAAITNTSTGTPAMTPTTDFAAATPPAASSSTFATLPATTLNTPPKGIVNSVQLEKELFRMFANAIMYNKSTTEIGKETVVMARDVEGMVDNFRTAEEAGMKKALGAAATGGGFGSAKKGGVRERETTVGTAGDEEQSISGDKGEDGDGEDSVMGDTDGASEKGKGKAIVKRKRLKR